MTNKLKKAINEYAMLNGVKAVIVALSGGADSVALLHCMNKVCKELEISLSAAHLNHTLRADESDRDEDFCRELCKNLNIPILVRREDVQRYAEESKQSIELAARDKRYSFFSEICNADTVVATAHTASDNLETMLLNLTRGTAIKGLCGIPPKRDIFIRPLIYCTRSDIEAYCKENNLDFVTDSSNLTDDYTRNVIRHKVISVLKDINPSVETNAANTAESLRKDNLFLQQKSEELFDEIYDGESVDANLLNEADYALKSRVVAKLLKLSGCSVSAVLVNKICDMLSADFPRFSVTKDVYCALKNGRLYIVSQILDTTEYKVKIEQILTEDLKKTQKINSLLLKNAFDCDKIVGKPQIRTRIEQDTIKLIGRPQKTLKKLYNECKIPNNKRQNLPVIADDKGVIWVMGVGVAERVKVDKNSQKIGLIQY